MARRRHHSWVRRRYRAASLAVSALCLLASARADSVYDNGPPGLLHGEEMTHWIEANQFSLSGSYYVGSLTFWDVEAAPPDFQSTIYWEIRNNSSSNTPGQTIYSGLATSVSHTATGRDSFRFPEF